MLKLDVYPQEGTCPLCQSTNVDFQSNPVDEAGFSYSCECLTCGATWEDCYDLVFAGQWNIADKKGNEFDDLPT